MLCVPAYVVCTCMCAHATAYMWRSRTTCESQLSSSTIAVLGLGGMCPYPLGRLLSPPTFTLTDPVR